MALCGCAASGESRAGKFIQRRIPQPTAFANADHRPRWECPPVGIWTEGGGNAQEIRPALSDTLMPGTMQTAVTSFVLGLLATTSPCILPLYPGFLAYLSGQTQAGSGKQRY